MLYRRYVGYTDMAAGFTDHLTADSTLRGMIQIYSLAKLHLTITKDMHATSEHGYVLFY